MNNETDGNSCKKIDYWKQQVVAWEQSGKTQKEFCRQQEISVPAFGYWKRKLRPQQSEAVEFYPLTIPVTKTPPASSGISLVTNDSKFHIELSTDFVPRTLKALLHTLAQI